MKAYINILMNQFTCNEIDVIVNHWSKEIDRAMMVDDKDWREAFQQARWHITPSLGYALTEKQTNCITEAFDAFTVYNNASP